MNNIVMLPTWANVLFFTAIIILCVLAWGPKVKRVVSKLSLPEVNIHLRSAYYGVAVVILLALAGIFFALSPIQGVPISYLVMVDIIFFLTIFIACFACIENKAESVLAVAGVIDTILIIAVTLLHCNIAFMAIWMGALITFGVIGYLLFHSNKKG